MQWNPCKDYDKYIYLDNKSSYFYDPTGTYHYNYQLIALSEEQWEKVLTDCGFMIDAMYGDYALNPYFPSESTKILLTAIPKEAKF